MNAPTTVNLASASSITSIANGMQYIHCHSATSQGQNSVSGSYIDATVSTTGVYYYYVFVAFGTTDVATLSSGGNLSYIQVYKLTS